MGRSEYDPRESDHKAWNAGKLVGAKRALKPQQVCTRPVATALRDVSCRAENSAYGQSYAQDVGSAGDRRDRASAALDRRREGSDRPREHGGSSASGSNGTSAQHLPIHAGLLAPHLQGGRVCDQARKTTISSALCRFLGIPKPSSWRKSHSSGRTTSQGADHPAAGLGVADKGCR